MVPVFRWIVLNSRPPATTLAAAFAVAALSAAVGFAEGPAGAAGPEGTTVPVPCAAETPAGPAPATQPAASRPVEDLGLDLALAEIAWATPSMESCNCWIIQCGLSDPCACDGSASCCDGCCSTLYRGECGLIHYPTLDP